jgi:hypothetical protein
VLGNDIDKDMGQPLLSNGFTIKHVSATTIGYTKEERCFLCGLCRDVISRKSYWTESENAGSSGTALARTSSDSKLQTRPLVREAATKITKRNYLKENLKDKEKLVAGPSWAPDTKTDWPTDCRL